MLPSKPSSNIALPVRIQFSPRHRNTVLSLVHPPSQSPCRPMSTNPCPTYYSTPTILSVSSRPGQILPPALRDCGNWECSRLVKQKLSRLMACSLVKWVTHAFSTSPEVRRRALRRARSRHHFPTPRLPWRSRNRSL